jgi:transposase InsO family protein
MNPSASPRSASASRSLSLHQTPPSSAASCGAISTDLRAQIQRVAFDLRLASDASDYIRQCIEHGPSRRVQGRLGNVVTSHYSQKMNCRLLLESRRGEHAQAILLERDPEVIAYFAQPPSVELVVTDAGGKPQTTLGYTPDFLVLEKDGVLVIEMRDLGRLLERHQKNPQQFYRDDDGRWHYRAAETRFQEMGLRYELRSNSDLPACLIENVRFLEDYVSQDCPPLTGEQSSRVVQAVQDRRHAKLQELLDLGISADHLYKAIADGVVYVDLSTDRLASSAELTIFSDQVTHEAYRLARLRDLQPALPIPGTIWLKPGSQLSYSGTVYTVLMAGERDVFLQDQAGQQVTMGLDALMQAHKVGILKTDGIRPTDNSPSISDYTQEELTRAAKRLDALRAGTTEEFGQRSLERFRALTAHAQNDLEALLALVDRNRDKGNTTSRLSDRNLALIESTIGDRYNTPENRRITQVYEQYSARCQVKDQPGGPLRPVSYPTFCKYVKQLESITARKGRRAAYQQSPIAQSLENAFPIHGVRPHEVCYIDHTIANIALVSPHGNELGKPTLTIAVDGNTAHPRALILSFDPPSARTVLNVMRDYVRRHNRLPRTIVVDNGKEFHSETLALFCKLYGIEIRYRPPGMPRGGAMIERLLGASEEEVLANMAGNTRILKKDARLVTKSVDPFRRAEWTLPAVYRALDEYLFEERPNRVHPALGVTPNEFEQRRLAETGTREFKGVQFDENLLLLTSPHPRVRFHKVDPQRGVWVNGLWYQHPSLREQRKGTRVEVRVEPWNASVIYVQTKTGWVAAVGNNNRWLVRRTQREVEIALREEKRRANKDAHRATLKRQAHRHKTWIPSDFDPRLAEQQNEMRYLYEGLGMTTALPEPLGLIQPATTTPPGAASVSEDSPPAPVLSPGGLASVSTPAPSTEHQATSKFEGALDRLGIFY